MVPLLEQDLWTSSAGRPGQNALVPSAVQETIVFCTQKISVARSTGAQFKVPFAEGDSTKCQQAVVLREPTCSGSRLKTAVLAFDAFSGSN